MDGRVTIVATETLSDNWGRLTQTTLDYTRSDGGVQRLRREVYDHGNAAAILLFDPGRQTVLLVRQFRYPATLNGDDAMMLECCAGLLDGDTPEACAQREAIEESGHAPRSLDPVCDVYASPGSLTEKVSLFIGEYDATTVQGTGGGLVEEGEDIEIVEMPLQDALAMCGDGRIMDAKTVILLQHLALRRRLTNP